MQIFDSLLGSKCVVELDRCPPAVTGNPSFQEEAWWYASNPFIRYALSRSVRRTLFHFLGVLFFLPPKNPVLFFLAFGSPTAIASAPIPPVNRPRAHLLNPRRLTTLPCVSRRAATVPSSANSCICSFLSSDREFFP